MTLPNKSYIDSSTLKIYHNILHALPGVHQYR